MQLLTSKTRFSLQNTVLILAVLCAAVVTVVGIRVFAATSAVSPGVASGLAISPASIELNGEKGKTYVIPLKVHNVTTGTLSYTPTVDDFGAKDETGTVKLLPPGDLPPTASMISWVKPPVESFTLQGGEIRQINIKVVIPANAEAGGHYGVINFTSSGPATAGNAVGVRASTGLLVLATVAGATKENLSLASLTTESGGHQSSVFQDGQITFVTRLHNIGNVHVKPTGTITVSDMFGKLVDTLKVNESAGNVLPNSIRRFESPMNKDWLFGRYTADLTIGYGTKGEVVQGEITFWVIPWKVVGTVLIVLITLIFIIWQLLRANNKRVIKKYKKSNENHAKKE